MALVLFHSAFKMQQAACAMLHELYLFNLAYFIPSVWWTAGKSSLLAALLGEMYMEGGTIAVAGSVAYAAQDPWIQNATLRDNVLMGNAYDEDR